MEFILERTSLWDGKPHPKATTREVIRFSDCTCKTVEEALKHEWVRNGIAEQRNGFVRVFNKKKSKVWTIKFSTLDDLIKFHKNNGGLVLKTSSTEVIPCCIEIYDGYRE